MIFCPTERDPLRHNSTDLRIAHDTLVRIQEMVVAFNFKVCISFSVPQLLHNLNIPFFFHSHCMAVCKKQSFLLTFSYILRHLYSFPPSISAFVLSSTASLCSLGLSWKTVNTFHSTFFLFCCFLLLFNLYLLQASVFTQSVNILSTATILKHSHCFSSNSHHIKLLGE